MPTYDYTCQACRHKIEAFQKITEAPLLKCPACGKESLMRGPGGGIGLQFHGDGFYKTMYGPKHEASEPSSPGDASPPTGGCCPCGKNKNSCQSTKD